MEAAHRALRDLPVLPCVGVQRRTLVDARVVPALRRTAARTPAPGLSRRDRPRERLDEVLELARRPALERLAVALVRGDDAVAVVPVQPRLGVEPERAPGARGDCREDVRPRVAPVRARVAEDDFDWSVAGEKKLKGLQKPIKTFRPRPRGSKEEEKKG